MAIKSLLKRWQTVILIAVLIRIFIFVFTALAHEKNISNFASLWIVWDSDWYISIAKDWYQKIGENAVAIVFYPLYPTLIKVTSFFINDLPLFGLLVSFLFSIIASILLFEVTLLDFNKRIATKAVFFLNIFPTSYFLQAIYTESLFLSISLLCFLLLRKGKLLGAGLAGMFATLTRINGLFLIPIFFIENQSESIYKKFFAAILASIGFFTYLFINFFTFGNFFQFSETLKNNWSKQLDFSWKGILGGVDLLSYYEGDYLFSYYFELPTVLLIFIIGIFAFLKIRKSYGIYTLLNCLLFISTSFILSTPRYALILFPIYIALAMIKSKFITVVLSLSFISLLCYFSYIFTQGRWTF